MTTAASERPLIPWYRQSLAERSALLHGRFVTEGTMVAFPLCLPGASLPIIHDESAITALTSTPEGLIYGGTSGHATHLFAGLMHGAGGGVLDLGVVPAATECSAIACASGKIAACVNGPAGGRIVVRDKQELGSDMIQEWDFDITPLREAGQPVPGERILHAAVESSGRWLVGLTEGHLFRFDMLAEKAEMLTALPALNRVAADTRGNVFGMEASASSMGPALWRYAADANRLTRNAFSLPAGAWENYTPVWTQHPVTGELFFSDAAGAIYRLKDEAVTRLASAPLQPILSMAATADDRIFGMCGEGICRLFGLDLTTLAVKPLAAIASVLQTKRYGHLFASAALGRDGQIIFGENDNNAHLWFYFPRVKGHPHAG
jgi:hypothetical protein